MPTPTRVHRLIAKLTTLALLGAASAATAATLSKSFGVTATFNRTTELCGNGVDDDGDGLVDDHDSDCQGGLGGWGGSLTGSMPGDTDLHPLPVDLIAYGGLALVSESDAAYGGTSATRRGRVQVFRTLYDVMANGGGMASPYLEVYGTADGYRVGSAYAPTEYGHLIGMAGLDQVGAFRGGRTGYATEGDDDFRLYGTSGSDFGDNVAVGDFDGDGYQDVAVAAPKYDYGSTDTGQVSVFWGPLKGDQSVWSGTTRIYGEEAGENLGAAGMTVADTNGDGFEDLVIGSPYRDSNGYVNNGRTYVFSGRDLHAKAGSYGRADAMAAMTLDGEASYSYSGWDVAAGEIAGLSGPSTLVSAPYYSSGRGRVYNVPTYKTGGGDLGSLVRYEYTGDSTYDYLGWRVAVGDHDHDGTGDVIMSAPYEDTYASNAGAIYMLSNPRVLDHTSQAMFWGDHSSGKLGFSMNVGHADWDGEVDLLAVSSGGSTPHSATYQSSITWR